MSRPRKGDIAQITFYDHGENVDGPIFTEVFGRVVSAKGASYEIESWRLPNEDPVTQESNRTKFTILKKVVIDAQILVLKENKNDNSCSRYSRASL